MKRSDGFSLLELLVYMAGLAIVMVMLVGIFFSLNTGRGKIEAQAEVNSNLRFAIDKIESDLRTATAVSVPVPAGAGTSFLQMTTASGTIVYCMSSSTLWRLTTSTPVLASWANTTALPTPLEEHSTVSYNGYLYEMGGYTGSAGTSSVRYAKIDSNGSVGSWTNATALPGFLEPTSVAYNGYIYVVGGYNGGAVANVRFAQINSTGSLGSWTDTTALPSASEEHDAIAYNGYLYVIGGNNNTNDTTTVRYVPINSTGSLGSSWTNINALPATLQNHSAVAYNGYIYVTGGATSTTPSPTSTVLYTSINSDGTIGSWANATALPATTDEHSAVVNNGYLYVVGGSTGSAVTSTISYAPLNSDGSVGSWKNITALPAARRDFNAVVSNGYLYVMGGDTSNGGDNTTSTVNYAAFVCSGDAITANTVSVSNLTFTRLENTNTVLGKTIVSIQADLALSYKGTGPEEQYSDEKITTVSLRN